MNLLRRFALATTYVTCFPLCRQPLDTQSEGLDSLSKYLPAVGLLLGSILLLLAWIFHLMHLNPLLNAVLLVICWLALSGGIHFDGLMDTADGVFSHRDPQRMLEIMSDSRVGNFGAMVGFGNLLLKATCLASLPYSQLAPIVFLVPAWARLAEVYAIGSFPYLKAMGMGKIWHDSTKFPNDLILSFICPLLATIGTALVDCPLKLALLASLSTLCCGVLSAHRLAFILKGQTGDTYGAVVELSETGALLICAVASQCL